MYFHLYLFKTIGMKSNRESKIADEILKEIGVKVRDIRKSQYKNYEEFAKANGFNKVTVSRLEHGENVNLKTLIEVLCALNVPVNDFFSQMNPNL